LDGQDHQAGRRHDSQSALRGCELDPHPKPVELRAEDLGNEDQAPGSQAGSRRIGPTPCGNHACYTARRHFVPSMRYGTTCSPAVKPQSRSEGGVPRANAGTNDLRSWSDGLPSPHRVKATLASVRRDTARPSLGSASADRSMRLSRDQHRLALQITELRPGQSCIRPPFSDAYLRKAYARKWRRSRR